MLLLSLSLLLLLAARRVRRLAVLSSQRFADAAITGVLMTVALLELPMYGFVVDISDCMQHYDINSDLLCVEAHTPLLEHVYSPKNRNRETDRQIYTNKNITSSKVPIQPVSLR